MGLSDERSAVRRTGRLARAGLEDSKRQHAQRKLVAHLFSLDALSAASVGLFVADDGEPDLMPLVERLWSREQTVALPVLEDDPNDFSMRFEPWRPHDDLLPGRYGIPVPPSRKPIEPQTLLVSFTGFDAMGNRIGRGAGFFDRYLAGSNSTAIGVGFEVQRFDRVPVADHDQALPTVVTDLGVRHIT